MKTKQTAKKSVKLVKGTGKGLGKSERTRQMAAYTKEKLVAQKKIKVGATLKYHGRNAKLQGKSFKIKALEGTQGGVIIQDGKRTVHVSPFAFIKQAAAK